MARERSEPRRGGGAKYHEQKRRPYMLKEFLSTWVNALNLPSIPRSDSPLLVHLTLSDEDTTELPPCPSCVEFLITDHCGKIRLPSKIPAETLSAYVRHHFSDQGGISPIVRSWYMSMFCQMYPSEDFSDVPCHNFNIHSLDFNFIL